MKIWESYGWFGDERVWESLRVCEMRGEWRGWDRGFRVGERVDRFDLSEKSRFNRIEPGIKFEITYLNRTWSDLEWSLWEVAPGHFFSSLRRVWAERLRVVAPGFLMRVAPSWRDLGSSLWSCRSQLERPLDLAPLWSLWRLLLYGSHQVDPKPA